METGSNGLAGSTETYEDVKQELARRKLISFTRYTFPNYKVKPHNLLIADTLDLVVYGIITRLMVFLPPQYGKSELVSRRFPPFFLGRNPDKKIIQASYNRDLASSFTRQSREIVQSKEYQKLFGVDSYYHPPVKLSDSKKSASEWNLAHHRGGVFAAGVTGGMTGYSADLMVIDDPVKDDIEASSPTTRQRQSDWFWSVAYSRLSPDAPIILCMTRWHEDDLAGRLLKTQDKTEEFYYVLRLPAMAETEEQTEKFLEQNFIQPEYYLNREMVDELRKQI